MEDSLAPSAPGELHTPRWILLAMVRHVSPTAVPVKHPMSSTSVRSATHSQTTHMPTTLRKSVSISALLAKLQIPMATAQLALVVSSWVTKVASRSVSLHAPMATLPMATTSARSVVGPLPTRRLPVARRVASQHVQPGKLRILQGIAMRVLHWSQTRHRGPTSVPRSAPQAMPPPATSVWLALEAHPMPTKLHRHV